MKYGVTWYREGENGGSVCLTPHLFDTLDSARHIAAIGPKKAKELGIEIEWRPWFDEGDYNVTYGQVETEDEDLFSVKVI